MAPLGKDTPGSDLRPSATATVVARDASFTGELRASGGLRVEGRLSGSAEAEGALEIVEGATVTADLRGGSVRIAGSVTGNVTGARLVELLATAVVKGDITAPSLHVVEGATLDGRLIMRGGKVAEGPRERD